MIKSELVQIIANRNPHLFLRDVENIVNAIFDEITDALADGNRVELRGFGAFSVKNRPARTGRNPRTGESVDGRGKMGAVLQDRQGIARTAERREVGVTAAPYRRPRPDHDMYNRFLLIVIFVPLAIVLIALAVANRAPVAFTLDPFNPGNPALTLNPRCSCSCFWRWPLASSSAALSPGSGRAATAIGAPARAGSAERCASRRIRAAPQNAAALPKPTA